MNRALRSKYAQYLHSSSPIKKQVAQSGHPASKPMLIKRVANVVSDAGFALWKYSKKLLWLASTGLCGRFYRFSRGYLCCSDGI